MCKKFIMLFVLLMLTACGIFGSYYEAEPVGVGKGVDELKLLPAPVFRSNFLKTCRIGLLKQFNRD